MVIGRPKKDPDDKRGITLTFKVTNAEHVRLSKLARHREEEIRQATGQHFDVTMASYLRWLVDVDAQKRGIALEDHKGEPETVELETAPVVAAKELRTTGKRPAAKKAPKEKDLRDELAKYRARHDIAQRAFAPMIGVGSQSTVWALEAKTRVLTPDSEARFRKLLEAEG